MRVKVYGTAIAGMLISMTSPGFFMTAPHCLTFDYEVVAAGQTPSLEIHICATDSALSGVVVWTSIDYDAQRNKARITMLAANTSRDLSYVLDFVDILASPTSTLIRVANVEYFEGHCKDEQAQFAPGEIAGIVMLQEIMDSVSQLKQWMVHFDYCKSSSQGNWTRYVRELVFLFYTCTLLNSWSSYGIKIEIKMFVNCSIFCECTLLCSWSNYGI